MTKRIIYGTGAAVLIIGIITGFGWIAKQEIEKGKSAHMAETMQPSEAQQQAPSVAVPEETVTVTDKAEAESALDEMGSMMSDLEKTDETESQQ